MPCELPLKYDLLTRIILSNIKHQTSSVKHQTSNIDLFYLGIDAVYVSGHKTSSKSTINCLIDFIELNDNLLKPNYFVLSVCASD